MIVDLLSGVALPFFLLLAGAYFTAKLGRYFIKHPVRAFWGMLEGGEGGTSPVRALAVALAGTLGVGNIAGVATAIAFGGPGAVFWMWVAAFLVMSLKYAEIVLALATRRYECATNGRVHGGAMYYIKEAFGGGAVGRALAAIFAVLCVLLALTLGTMIQSGAAAEALQGVFHMPTMLVGGVMGGLAVLLLFLGAKRVEGACAALVPFACLLFCILSAGVLYLRRAALPEAFAAIFRGAFTVQGATGGVFGFFTGGAVRYGVSRGLVSNEAGCGTAPIAHAASNAKSPAQQGFWGIFEVFVDTILLCTLTALVILVSGVEMTGGGVFSAIRAYGESLGSIAPPLLAILITLFAFATVLCWSHYGLEALSYLTRSRYVSRFFLGGVALSTMVGATLAPAFVWELTDIVLALMTLLNLLALFLSRRRIEAETKAFFEGEL